MVDVPYNPNILVAGPPAAPASMSQDYAPMAQPKTNAVDLARRRRRRGRRR